MVFRASHRDIQDSLLFCDCSRSRALAEKFGDEWMSLRFRNANMQAKRGFEHPGLIMLECPAKLRQEYDRKFESLRGVNSHDLHGIACLHGIRLRLLFV